MQISLFDGSNKFVIDKPIRLIELFAGYGSQHFALEYLSANFESWKICEWAVKSIQAYKDAHFKDDNIDYSKELTKEQVFEFLSNKGISQNYNEPMTFDQIKRMGEEKARTIYNNIKATHNLVNIQQVHGKDLEITDVNKYCYIMTYSFPCQDLSLAGLGKGMEKGSGTRSGMLWEVERMLDEIRKENMELPQVLVMENVPEVIGTNNIKHFAKWVEKLEQLGYKNKWQILNGKDYGIPQNRERCFMVSILGDYYYDFPDKIKLQLKLKDLLEANVDEKFYLSDAKIKSISKWKAQQDPLKDIDKEKIICPTLTARGAGEEHSGMVLINEDVYKQDCVNIKGQDYPITKNYENYIEWHQDGLLDMDTRAWKTDKVSPTLHTSCGNTKILEENLKTKLGIVVKDNYLGTFEYVKSDNFMQGKDRLNVGTEVANTILTGHSDAVAFADLRIRKMTPKECFRLMGVRDEDFERIAENQSNASLFHLAGDSIIVNVLMAIFKEMLC